MARRTLNLSDEAWRGLRLRAVSDGKTASEVAEAVITSAVLIGGPILYGDGAEVNRQRYIHEWVGGTEAGHAAKVAFAAELADESAFPEKAGRD
jgi:hypothetical protein